MLKKCVYVSPAPRLSLKKTTMFSLSKFYYFILSCILVIYLLIYLPINLSGENLINSDITFTNTTKENGLSSEQVNDIIEDRLGFIWFATSNGLNRFDGVDIKKFLHTPNDHTSISNNNILCIDNAKNGDLWIGTHKGINRYNFKTGKFEHEFFGLSNQIVFTIFEEDDNFLWIGAQQGLFALNLTTNKVQDFSYLPHFNELGILDIKKDKRGRLWIGTWEGGLHLLTEKKVVADTLQLEFKQFQVSTKDGGDRVWALYPENENRMWIGTFGGGLFLMNIKTPNKNILSNEDIEFTSFEIGVDADNKISQNQVTCITQNNNGNIWLSTLGGINIFNPNEIAEGNIHFKKKYNSFRVSNSLISNEVWKVYSDSNNMIWLASAIGVSKHNPYKKKFKRHYPLQKYQSESIRTILEDKEGMHWIGTDHIGLIKYNPINNETESIKIGGFVNIFENIRINDLKLQNENLWIGSAKGLSKLNLNTKQIKEYQFFLNEDTDQKNPIIVRKILMTKQGNFWLATHHGVIFVDGVSMEYIIYNINDGIVSNDVFYVEEDKNGAIWIATYSGASKINRQGKKITSLNFESSNSENDITTTIVSNSIHSLITEGENIWLGTINGFSQINVNTHKITNHKLPLEHNDIVAGMLIDDDRNLWFMGRQGISQYNPETGNQIAFTTDDGLHGNNFSLNSKFKSQTGEMFFAGVGGYTSFHPDSISSNKNIPDVYITDVKVFNKSLLLESNILSTDEINISYKQNFISFEYMAMNFNQSEKNQYQYMLDGFDEGWIYAGTKKTATYTNLDGGDYTFRVKASNNDGYWNEAGRSIKLNIKPPYWETWWFRILLICSLLLLVLLIHKIRTTQLKKRSLTLINYNRSLNHEIAEKIKTQQALIINKEKLQELVLELEQSNESLQNFAYVASHDLVAPLKTSYSFINLLKKKYSHQLDESGNTYIIYAMKGLQQMKNLVDSLLKFSKVGLNQDRYELVNPKEIIEDKLFNLKSLIDEKDAVVELNVLEENIFCEPEEIGIVFNNLINNGIKYNRKERPLIFINQVSKADYWEFAVSDNGIGIDNANQQKIFNLFQRLHGSGEFEGSGIGLSICQKIIEAHGGKIWLSSKIENGTTFYFTIKKQNALQTEKIVNNTIKSIPHSESNREEIKNDLQQDFEKPKRKGNFAICKFR